MLPNNLEHGIGVGSLFEGLAEIGFVQKLGNIRERVEMFLELPLWHQKQHDEIYRLIVQRIEIDSLARTTKRADDFLDQIRAGVGDANAEADTRAHGRLALLHYSGDGIVMLGFDLAGRDEVVDQLVNRLPAVRRLQIGDDLRVRKNVA